MSIDSEIVQNEVGVRQDTEKKEGTSEKICSIRDAASNLRGCVKADQREDHSDCVQKNLDFILSKINGESKAKAMGLRGMIEQYFTEYEGTTPDFRTPDAMKKINEIDGYVDSLELMAVDPFVGKDDDLDFNTPRE